MFSLESEEKKVTGKKKGMLEFFSKRGKKRKLNEGLSWSLISRKRKEKNSKWEKTSAFWAKCFLLAFETKVRKKK